MYLLIILMYFFFNILVFIFYPIHYLDFYSTIISYAFLKYFNFIAKKRLNIVEYNLKKIFPEKNNKEIQNIKYQCTKISLINILIGLFGIFIYNFTYIDKYININIPQKMKIQEKSNGILLLGNHYSLFYIVSIFFGKLSNINHNIVFKKQIIINYLIYNKFYKNTNFIEKNNNTVSNILKIKGGIISMLIEQKNGKSIYKFLNHDYRFTSSPSFIYKNTNRKIWVVYVNYTNKIININFEELNLNNLNDKEINQYVADKLTNQILNNPSEYYWFYNLFDIGKNKNNKNKINK